MIMREINVLFGRSQIRTNPRVIGMKLKLNSTVIHPQHMWVGVNRQRPNKA
jgi:hypothetical protein